MSDQKKPRSSPAEKPFSLHPLTFDEALAKLLNSHPLSGDGHAGEPEPVEEKQERTKNKPNATQKP